jgi:hypothetical protein
VKPEIHRRIENVLRQQVAEDAEVIALLLETLRDILLDLPPIEFDGPSDNARIRLASAAAQLLRGVLFHLGGDSGADLLSDLKVQIDLKQAAFEAKLTKRESLCRQLQIQETDIDSLQEELGMLEKIAGYEKLRKAIQACSADREAYQAALKTAGCRAASEKNRLQQLADSVEELLSQQRDILRIDFQAQLVAWQGVEKEIFGN